jgi:hypothetical protein
MAHKVARFVKKLLAKNISFYISNRFLRKTLFFGRKLEKSAENFDHKDPGFAPQPGNL